MVTFGGTIMLKILCPECGKELSKDAEFCESCLILTGNKIPLDKPAEQKLQYDRGNLLDAFIPWRGPVDWLVLKEESSYPKPLPFFLLLINLLPSIGASIVAVVMMVFTLGFSIFIIPIIMIIRYLTVNKPNNLKRHLSFFAFSFASFLFLSPVFYWYFYRKSNVVEYYKQFEKRRTMLEEMKLLLPEESRPHELTCFRRPNKNKHL